MNVVHNIIQSTYCEKGQDNWKRDVHKWINGCGLGAGHGKNHEGDQARGYKQELYRLQHCPTLPLSNLPHSLVLLVTVGPAKANYFRQYGGGPSSVASTYMSASTTQHEFFMANVGKKNAKETRLPTKVTVLTQNYLSL